MIHSGCDSSVSRFSFAVVILVQQQQRTSPQPTSQQSRHSHHDANNDAIHTTTPPSTNTPPPSSPLVIQHAPRGHDLRGTGERSGVAAAKARKDISRLKLLPEYLPPEFLPRESSSGSSSCLVRRGRGGAASPDWWMRGVTRPGRRNAPLRDFSGNAAKGGGARNGAEHRAERRVEPRATKGTDEEGSRLRSVGWLVVEVLFLRSRILASCLLFLPKSRLP